MQDKRKELSTIFALLRELIFCEQTRDYIWSPISVSLIEEHLNVSLQTL